MFLLCQCIALNWHKKTISDEKREKYLHNVMHLKTELMFKRVYMLLKRMTVYEPHINVQLEIQIIMTPLAAL